MSDTPNRSRPGNKTKGKSPRPDSPTSPELEVKQRHKVSDLREITANGSLLAQVLQ